MMRCLWLVMVLGGCGDDDSPDLGGRDASAPGSDAASPRLDGSVDGSVDPDGGSPPDGAVAQDAGSDGAIPEPRPCEFPTDVTNTVEVTVTPDDWSFTETYQQWYTTIVVDQTLRQGEHFGVRVVFEGERPKHESFLRRHDSDPDDDVDDSVPGMSSLLFRVHQQTVGTSVQPLWYDASVPIGYYRPTLETGGTIAESTGGFVTGYNNTVDYTEFGHDTRTEGTVDCAVIWGTPLFPPPIQSYSELEVGWRVLWAISPADRSNDDGYSPILEPIPE